MRAALNLPTKALLACSTSHEAGRGKSGNYIFGQADRLQKKSPTGPHDWWGILRAGPDFHRAWWASSASSLDRFRLLQRFKKVARHMSSGDEDDDRLEDDFRISQDLSCRRYRRTDTRGSVGPRSEIYSRRIGGMLGALDIPWPHFSIRFTAVPEDPRCATQRIRQKSRRKRSRAELGFLFW